MKHHPFIDHATCSSLIAKFVETRASHGVSVRNPGDHRIFGFERFISKDITQEMFDLDADYIRESCGLDVKYQTLMVNHTFMEPGALGSGEGWHRDSVRSKQFKTIFYLVPVNLDNGPFRIFLNKSFILDFVFWFKRRLSDDIVNFAGRFGIKPKIITSDTAGFGFSANTNQIHRGSTITNGERYAVTVYSYLKEPDKGIYELATGELKK